jgi:cobaltochelatase CobS
MVEVADLSRQSFINGDISTVMCPRSVITSAWNTVIFQDIGFAFHLPILNKCDEAERTLLAEYYQRVLVRLCMRVLLARLIEDSKLCD